LSAAGSEERSPKFFSVIVKDLEAKINLFKQFSKKNEKDIIKSLEFATDLSPLKSVRDSDYPFEE
jgi:hypothetical protein